MAKYYPVNSPPSFSNGSIWVVCAVCGSPITLCLGLSASIVTEPDSRPELERVGTLWAAVLLRCIELGGKEMVLG